MSLLDDWEAQPGHIRDGFDDINEAINPTTEYGNQHNEQPISSEAGHAMFSLETARKSLSRGRGEVTALAAANNYITAGTSRGWLIRYDVSEGNTPVSEIEASKTPHSCIEDLWVDPSGVHHIFLLKQQDNFEVCYLHSKWKKARPLGKLKGAQVTSVGWNPETGSESSTGEVAIGTSQGHVVAVSIEEKEKKERGGKAILELTAGRNAIKGLAQLPLQQDRLLLLVSTAKRLYAFVGPSSLEKLGEAYAASAGQDNFIELPTELDCGQLACYTPPGAIKPSRFVWLAGPGLYRGALELNSDSDRVSGLDYLTDRSLLPLPLLPATQEDVIAVAQTEYHELILYSSCVHIVNRISHTLVQELALNSRSTDLPPGVRPLGFAEDVAAGLIFIFTSDSLVEVVSEDEERDLWKIFLDRKDFPNAFRRCRTQAQRDAVNNLEGELAFDMGRYLVAAASWGKVTSPKPSFEELALKFVNVGSPDALQCYLLTKLDALAPTEKAQATMIATWLTELSLDRLNRALLEESEGDASQSLAQKLTQELREFLKEHMDLLDPRTTIDLLASYGRLDDLMHYASYRQDNEAVLEYLLQQEDAIRAISLLRRPDVSQELFYKFAPGLMALAPAETVDAWMTASPMLDPKRLLPALLRCAAMEARQDCRTHTLRYLDFCLQRLLSEDPAIHQLAVSLYCSQGEEEKLMAHMETARDGLGRPLYDPQAALQLTRQFNLHQASIELLWQLRLQEEAVAMALQLDMQRAVGLANRPQEDESLQRKLWLAIALHLVQRASDGDQHPTARIKQVNDLMREAGGLLKIEDILPLFPDFVQIDNFKEAICQSLEDYNSQIAGLKTEMDDVTRISDALRKDMAKLEQRAATLHESEPCASCRRPVGEAPANADGSSHLLPYLLFPTGNAFHGICLANEVLALAPSGQKQRLKKLMGQQMKGSQSAEPFSANGQNTGLHGDELRSKLWAELSTEDPFNGEMVIRNIDKPFIVPDETAIVESWCI